MELGGGRKFAQWAWASDKTLGLVSAIDKAIFPDSLENVHILDKK
jgi:hypothetical protein